MDVTYSHRSYPYRNKLQYRSAHCSRRGGHPRARRPTFELLEDRRLLAADFGDAPLPYPTTVAEDGASHVAIGPMLGPTRDAEVDGTQDWIEEIDAQF